MASLKIIKKRITSVKSTQKITRAMKLVSAAKLRRASERAHAARPYEAELMSMVSQILNEAEWASDLTEVRSGPQTTALVVISTDRGLAGSINTNLFKHVLRRAAELKSETVKIIALGKKAAEFFKRRGFEVVQVHTDLGRKVDFAQIAQISNGIRKYFLDKNASRVEVFYSKFQSAMLQIPTTFQLLPFKPELNKGERKTFLFEPEPKVLLEGLVPMLLDFILYRFLLESIASEHGARMSAMESATKNAKDMIEKLTLQRNRARQAAITKELMEIIGGAEALSA